MVVSAGDTRISSSLLYGLITVPSESSTSYGPVPLKIVTLSTASSPGHIVPPPERIATGNEFTVIFITLLSAVHRTPFKILISILL